MTTDRRIFGDHWVGLAMNEWTIESPTNDDLKRALKQLDATAYTMITVEAGEDHYMTVGGGGGRYVVVVTFDNQLFFTLLCAEPVTGIVMLKAGGQEGDYPAEEVVGTTQALQAAEVFMETGDLDDGQQWVQSGQRNQ